MDYIKSIIPPIKPPTLTKLNTGSLTNLKHEGYKILSRISCNLFEAAQPTNSRPERRTIQSTHISTISSLVDKTKAGTYNADGGGTTTTTGGYDAKKENYGLYALKCNRSAIKNGLIMNVRTESPPTTAASPERLSAYASDINHEKFQPCNHSNDERATTATVGDGNNRVASFIGNNTNSHNFNSLSSHQEYYKIEFNDGSCGGLKEISNKSDTKTVNNEKFFREQKGRDDGDMLRKVPPPRKKKFSTATTTPTTRTQAKETCVVDGKVLSTVKSTKVKPPAPPPPPPAHPPPVRVLKSSHQQQNHENAQQKYRRNQQLLESDLSFVATNNSHLVNRKKIGTDTTTTVEICSTSALNLRKNISELYRIADTKTHHSSYDNPFSVITICPPPIGFASNTIANTKARKKMLTKQFSTTESVNIFSKTTYQDDAFSDFSDALSYEPIVPVIHTYETESHATRVANTNNSTKRGHIKDQRFSSINSSFSPDVDYCTKFNQINLQANPMKAKYIPPPEPPPSATTTATTQSKHFGNIQQACNNNSREQMMERASSSPSPPPPPLPSSSPPPQLLQKIHNNITLCMNNEPKLINNSTNSANTNINSNFQTKIHYANNTQQQTKQIDDKMDMSLHCTSSSVANINDPATTTSAGDVTTAIIPSILTADNANSSATLKSGYAATGGGRGDGNGNRNGGARRKISNNNNYEAGCNKNDKVTTRSVYVMNFVTV